MNAVLEMGSADTSSVPSVVFDSFTDINGTDLSAHTIGPTNTINTSWTDTSSVYKIQGNLAQTNTNALNFATCSGGNANNTVSCKVKITDAGAIASDAVGIFTRFQNVNNFWRAILFSNALDIYDMVAGTPTLRASTPLVISSGTFYNLVVSVNGTTITATETTTNTTVSFTMATGAGQTGVGIQGFNGTGTGTINFSNFQITNP
jgi:hypothetical protein